MLDSSLSSRLTLYVLTVVVVQGKDSDSIAIELSILSTNNHLYVSHVAPKYVYQPYEDPTILRSVDVDMSGNICLDILKEKWSAVYNVQTILLSLQSLLGEPNNASPLNAQAADLWSKDPIEYKRLLMLRYRPCDE